MIAIAVGATLLGLAAAWAFLGDGDPESTHDVRLVGEELIDDGDFADDPLERPGGSAAIDAAGAGDSTNRETRGNDLAEEDALEECPGAWRDPIRLFGDAQVRPSYQHKTMLGVSIANVAEGSFWEELGIDSGDLVIESQGAPIDSPQASVDLLNELERAEQIRLRIRTTEGRDRWIDWDAPEPPDPATLPAHCR